MIIYTGRQKQNEKFFIYIDVECGQNTNLDHNAAEEENQTRVSSVCHFISLFYTQQLKNLSTHLTFFIIV